MQREESVRYTPSGSITTTNYVASSSSVMRIPVRHVRLASAKTIDSVIRQPQRTAKSPTRPLKSPRENLTTVKQPSRINHFYSALPAQVSPAARDIARADRAVAKTEAQLKRRLQHELKVSQQSASDKRKRSQVLKICALTILVTLAFIVGRLTAV